MPTSEYRWWIWGDRNGKPLVLGGYVSEEKCDEIGTEIFDGLYDKACLNTIDKSKATSIIRHMKFEKTHDLEYSMKPVRHSLGKSDETEESD